MLASNQPYQRVDDGVGAGFIGGALAGGAAGGAAHKWGQQGLQAYGQRAMDKREFANSKIDAMTGDISNSKSFDKYAKKVDSADRSIGNSKKLSGLHEKGFSGGWKGKAAAYGGSIIAGGLLGMGADALND